MKITKKNDYAIDDNTPKEYLYIREIILRNYNNPEINEIFLQTLNNYNIYQYNYNNAKDSDYFMWQYVNDKNEKDYKHISLTAYQNDMKSIFKMWKLYEICKNTDMDIDVEIRFNDIRELIKKIDNDIEFRNELRNKQK